MFLQVFCKSNYDFLKKYLLYFIYCFVFDFQFENIVLKDRMEKKIKLIDFGLVKIILFGEIVRVILGILEFVGICSC